MDRKYKIVYVVLRRDLENNESIPCGVFHAPDYEEADSTVAAYNQEFEDKGISGFKFELFATALYEQQNR